MDGPGNASHGRGRPRIVRLPQPGVQFFPQVADDGGVHRLRGPRSRRMALPGSPSISSAIGQVVHRHDVWMVRIVLRQRHAGLDAPDGPAVRTVCI